MTVAEAEEREEGKTESGWRVAMGVGACAPGHCGVPGLEQLVRACVCGVGPVVRVGWPVRLLAHQLSCVRQLSCGSCRAAFFRAAAQSKLQRVYRAIGLIHGFMRSQQYSDRPTEFCFRPTEFRTAQWVGF